MHDPAIDRYPAIRFDREAYLYMRLGSVRHRRAYLFRFFSHMEPQRTASDSVCPGR